MTKTEAGARAVLVLTSTADDESARGLALGLVEENLAACVSRSSVRSIYRWEDSGTRAPREMAVCEDEEVMLVVKTARSRIDDVQRFLLARHPYRCPEVVVVDALHVEERYLAWLLACVD
jgi:periplasmic divalent cation tolerance protein